MLERGVVPAAKRGFEWACALTFLRHCQWAYAPQTRALSADLQLKNLPMFLVGIDRVRLERWSSGGGAERCDCVGFCAQECVRSGEFNFETQPRGERRGVAD